MNSEAENSSSQIPSSGEPDQLAPDQNGSKLADAKNQRLSVTEKVGYGLGDTASNLFWKAFEFFLVYFYTDVFGISAKSAGTLMLVTRITTNCEWRFDTHGPLDSDMGSFANANSST